MGYKHHRREEQFYSLGYRLKAQQLVTPKGRIIPINEAKAGYLYSTVWDKELKKSVRITIHRFTAYIKYGSKLYDHQVVRHKDDNKQNNDPENLLLGSQLDNLLDKGEDARSRDSKLGSLTAGLKRAKLSNNDIEEILRKLKFITRKELTKEYNCSITLIERVVAGNVRSKEVIQQEIDSIMGKEIRDEM